MTHGALDTLGDQIVSGLLVSKYDHIDDALNNHPSLTCIESAHPVPDENSLLAGARLQQFLSQIPADATLLFLTSGGASSLVEVLPPGMTLQDLQRVNHYLLSSGLDINVMNVIRKSLSGIKGGRLAACLNSGRTMQLLISDVPGDSLNVIGSGLLIPSANATTEQVLLSDLADTLPSWLTELQDRNSAPPASDAAVWRTIESVIVASNQIACDAAAEQSRQLGLVVQKHAGELTGDVGDMARLMTEELTTSAGDKGVYIWGGETTVRLPVSPGRGGRNQQLALQLAVSLSKESSLPEWQLLVCGTDGSDGPTSDAGGFLDRVTLEKGTSLGLNAAEYLAAADAGSYLAATNALVTTGPTGTNVMDLAIVILL